MTDPRPRPQYGEYATPEQQAKAMGLPALPTHAAPPPFGQQPLAAPPPQRSGVAPVTGAHPWDRVITVILLTYGFVNVLITAVQFPDLATYINTQLDGPQGIGTFPSTPSSARLGTILIVSNFVVFGLTAVLSFRRLRTGRIAFWVPIVGALIAGIVAAACILPLVLPDPAYQAWAAHLMG